MTAEITSIVDNKIEVAANGCGKLACLYWLKKQQ
jgi:hypothetical protein